MMRSKLSARDQDLLQRFLDDQTSAEESRQCEERLSSDVVFRNAYDELKKLRELLQSGGRLEKDPAFWTRLSNRMQERETEEQSLLPFPQKYLPLAASGFAILVLLSFSYVFENRLSFLRFWESQTEAVRSAYEQTIAGGSFIPLFSGLDNDKTLQFALYGSLPLDESKGAMLNVDERTAEGYRIEVQKEPPRKQKKVTVADFVAEVRPTNVQKAVIESLLIAARRELESAVLVGQHEAVAINTDLSRLNRAMAAGIVSVLEPEQRVRLKRLLTEADAAYVSAGSRVPQSSEGVVRSVRIPNPTNSFVVLSPETVAIQALTIDLERIHREMKESQAKFREVQDLREKRIRWLVNAPVISGAGVASGTAPSRIRLKSRKDRLTIHIAHDSAEAGIYLMDVGAGRMYVEGTDSAKALQFHYEGEFPGGIVAAPKIHIVPSPARPDSVKPRKPFKLDID